MSGLLLAIALLTLVYALVLASFDPWDVLTGALLSTGLVIGLRDYLFGGWPAPIARLPGRILATIPLAWAVARDVTRGTVRVALVVLGRRPLRPGFVAVPLDGCTPGGLAAWSLALTLSPGSFLVDVDRERGEAVYHVIDASDPEAVRADFQDFYHRYQSRVIP